MDPDDDYSVEQIVEPQNNLVTLPTELIVFILSFLTCARDIVNLRYVSQRLQSVCETPSLWRRFIWPHFHIGEYHCVKRVLKSYGQYINHLSFPHHVTPCKLTPMLKHCSNLVKLRLSTNKLSCDQLIKAIQSTGKLQILDLIWKGDIPPLLLACNRLKELTIRAEYLNLYNVLTDWAMKGFIPETLNIFHSIYAHDMKELRQQWLLLNSSSPTTHISHFNIYGRCKVPMGLSPPLPDFQLQFGQSCTLSYVQASKYGLLGLEVDLLLLTNCSSERKALGRAKLISKISQRGIAYDITYDNHLNSDINSLTFITHFDAHGCDLHSGHLEQLAMACPNLLELNLWGNVECLKRLQGLRMITSWCQNLRGINLSFITVKDVENQVQLLSILAELKLIYLAIELCALLPSEVDEQTMGTVIGLYQKCLYLKALQFGSYCKQCTNIGKQGELLLLSNFTSLIHLSVKHRHPTVMKEIFGGCKQLKYFILSDWFDSTCTFVLNCKLEQLRINCDYVNIPDSFMESISTHGGLVHVFMRVKSITGNGVAALIENSPKIMTCHIVADRIIASEGKVISKCDRVKLRDFKMALKERFSDRKLFSCGCYSLARSQHSSYRITFQNTELVSLFN